MNMTHLGNMFNCRFLGFLCTCSGSFGLAGDPQICLFRKRPNGYNRAGRNATLRSIVFFFLKQRVRRRRDLNSGENCCSLGLAGILGGDG